MFYSHDVLNIRTGKLAIVWLAATGRIKFTKKLDSRELMGTTIHKVCDEIMRHIISRDFGSISTDRSPKRFSLYLSTMLMYGTVKVFNYQVIHLLDEAAEAFNKLLAGAALAKELTITTPRAKTKAVTYEETLTFDPLLFGTTLEEDFSLFQQRLEEGDYLTPRRISMDGAKQREPASKKKKIDQSQTEMDKLREDRTILPGKEIDLLFNDWDELIMPHHHLDTSAITLLDDIPIDHREGQHQLVTQLEDDYMGPPFSHLPEDFLKPPEELSAIEGSADISARDGEASIVHPQDGHIPTTEFQRPLPDEGELVILPPVVETPADHLVTRKSLIRKPKPKKPRLDPEAEITVVPQEHPEHVPVLEPWKISEETPRIPKEAPSAESQAEMLLESLEPVIDPHHRRQKKKRPFFDEFTQISSDNLKNQISYYHNTMRESEFYKDVIHVNWWKFMIDVDHLFHNPRKEIMSSDLRHLFVKGYQTRRIVDEQTDTEPRTSHSVRRELDFHDSGMEKGRSPATLGDLSNIDNISSFTHDVSKTSVVVDKSFPSYTEAALVQTSLIGQTTPLLPSADDSMGDINKFKDLVAVITNKVDPSKQCLEEIEKGNRPELPVSTAEFQVPTVVITPSQETETVKHPPAREPIRTDEISFEPPAKKQKPSSAIIEERELQPTEISSEQFATDTRKGKKSDSPDFGFSTMTIVAEVHAQPRIECPDVEVRESVTRIEMIDEQRRHMLSETIPMEHLEVHEFESELPIQKELPATKEFAYGPIHGDEQFIPSFISPVRVKAPLRQMVLTPETRSQRYLSVLLNMDDLSKRHKTFQLTLKDLLPPNATRSHVASLFGDLLGLHKKKKVRLSQEENYGKITIVKLDT